MWVIVIAIAGVLLGFGAGLLSTPTDDPSSKAPIDQNGSQPSVFSVTPGGAPLANVSPESSDSDISEMGASDQDGPGLCPIADSVTSTLTTTVSAGRWLVIATSLHITATGVDPPHPSLDLSEWLQRPGKARAFAGCFIATVADLRSISWVDGKLEADLDLKWNDTATPLDPIGYVNNPVKATVKDNQAVLAVDVCQSHPESANGVRMICRVGASNTVIVRVRRPIENVVSAPFPTGQAPKDDYFESTWQFAGPMPRLDVMLRVPANILLGTWLYWERGPTFPLPGHGSVRIDLYYLADASAIWLALLGVAFLVRRKQSADEPFRSCLRLVLIVLGGLFLGFELQALGTLISWLSNGVVVVISWAILAAAVARKRGLWVIAFLSVAALTPIIILAALPTLKPETTTNILLVWFCLALVVLVITGAWVLRHQIARLLFLANFDDRSIRDHRLRKPIDALMVAVLMYTIGFPIGVVLKTERHYWMAAELASHLIWSTGPLFRAGPLQWLNLLLAISYLACYLTSRRSGTIVPPGRDHRWTAIRWVRVSHAAVTAPLAMILCLSAPWTGRFALSFFIPVWVLQFGLLWMAVTLLSRGPRPPMVGRLVRQPPARAAQLFRAATAATPTAATVTESGDGGAATQPAGGAPAAAHTRDPLAGRRLLVLGSQRGRLANATASARVASVIAIVPVAYLMGTTLGQIGQIRPDIGIMIVALLAVLEFTRWFVSGFIFGYLYAQLPGQIGPVKALSFAAMWALSCLGPLVIAHGSGTDLTREAIYRCAQFALFSIVLAVAIDVKTVKAAGGTWRHLQGVYDLKNYREVTAFIAPAALLVLTLGQQILTGSGSDVANTLLSGITSVLKGPL